MAPPLTGVCLSATYLFSHAHVHVEMKLHLKAGLEQSADIPACRFTTIIEEEEDGSNKAVEVARPKACQGDMKSKL